MANTEKIDEVFSRITDENLNMNNWARKDGSDLNVSCGTTMCFAAHAVVAAGYEIDWVPLYDWNNKIVGWSGSNLKDGRDISDVARQVLGLTFDQADAIFMSTEIGSNIDLLREHVNAVLAGRTERYEGDYDYDYCGCGCRDEEY